MCNLTLINEFGFGTVSQVLVEKFGIVPSYIIGQMLYQSDKAEGDWFKFSTTYVMEKFKVGSIKTAKRIMDDIEEMGIFNKEVRGTGSGVAVHYRLKPGFVEWFMALIPDNAKGDYLHIVKGGNHPSHTQQKEKISRLNNKCISRSNVEKIKNKKPEIQPENQSSDFITFDRYIKEDFSELLKYFEDQGIDSDFYTDKIQRYYTKMKAKSIKRTSDKWFTEITQYVTRYFAPKEVLIPKPVTAEERREAERIAMIKEQVDRIRSMVG